MWYIWTSLSWSTRSWTCHWRTYCLALHGSTIVRCSTPLSATKCHLRHWHKAFTCQRTSSRTWTSSSSSIYATRQFQAKMEKSTVMPIWLWIGVSAGVVTTTACRPSTSARSIQMMTSLTTLALCLRSSKCSRRWIRLHAQPTATWACGTFWIATQNLRMTLHTYTTGLSAKFSCASTDWTSSGVSMTKGKQ